MNQLSRPFAALGIAWRRNLFFRTRLKLTALYVVVVALIISGFSIYLFYSIFHNLLATNPAYFSSMHSRMYFFEEIIEPIRYAIIGADIFVIALFALFSYWFAGKTLKPIENALESQRLFAAKASHELRTPLTVIRNDNEVTLRNRHASVTELRETLESGIEETAKMTELIEHLLVIARTEYTTSPTENVPIGELLQEVLSEVKSMQDATGVTFILKQQEGSIRGEYKTVKRAISNIVRNAIQHTPAGGTIEASSSIQDKNVSITISDSGSGIAKKDLPHVFERFYKGSVGSEKNGSGLGLAMVKEITEQYAGTVSIQSVEGEGTTVTLRFPNHE